MREEVRTALRRVLLAVLFFLTSLAMAVTLVLSGLLLEWIIGFSVDAETPAHKLISWMLDVTLVGSAVVWAAAGTVVATWEAVMSANDFVKRTSK